MSLSRPRSRLTLDGQALTGAEAALARVEIKLDSRGAHDWACACVWADSKFKAPAEGATLSIDLGEDGSETTVFTGKISRVERALDSAMFEALAPTFTLSRSRASQTYLDQSVADIVRALAQGCSLDAIECDLKLPVYSVGSGQTAWSALTTLAELVDADLGSNERGALRFVPPRSGSAETVFRYGAELLRFQGGACSSSEAEEIVAYGAGSEAGKEQWHWLLGDDAVATSGAAARALASARTRDIADTLNQARARRSERSKYAASFVVLGNTALRPGTIVGVSGLPSAEGGGLLGAAPAGLGAALGAAAAPAPPEALRVLCVHHVFDHRRGFTSDVRAEAVAA